MVHVEIGGRVGDSRENRDNAAGGEIMLDWGGYYDPCVDEGLARQRLGGSLVLTSLVQLKAARRSGKVTNNVIGSEGDGSKPRVR